MDISIIIPVYNLEKYIGDCLESCLMQDIEHYEVICVDDGSQDACGVILDKYAAEYPEIIRVVHKSNGGVSSARNVGIGLAQGDYLWFVDGDDCIKPNCLNNLLSIARSEKCDIMSIQNVMFDENLSFEDIKSINAEEKSIENIECIAFKVFKSDIIRQHNLLFDEKLTHGEDNIFIYEFMKKINKHVMMTDVIYYYRRRMNSASRSSSTQNKKNLYKSQIYQALYYQHEAENFDDTGYFSLDDIIYRRDLFLKRALITMCLFEMDEKIINNQLSRLEQAGMYPTRFKHSYNKPTGSLKERLYGFVQINLGKRWFFNISHKIARMIKANKG